MAKTYDISVDRGATFTFNVRYRDSANANILVDATEAEAQIREQPDSSTVLATFTCEFAADNEYITLTLPATHSANITTDVAYWDLKVTWPDAVRYLLKGKIKPSATVTRD